MIVVVGSRHDPVARTLAATLPGGALCGADDLTRAGWCWPLHSPEPACWVVEGRVVADADVSGVLVRRSLVYADELTSTHADDRDYLAAETTAFLAFVLARTRARVVNPPLDGALGDDALRPESWMRLAASVGMRVAPLALRSGEAARAPGETSALEVAAGRAFGGTPPSRTRALALAGALGLDYLTLVFDARGELLTLSTLTAPSAAAREALARRLGARA